MIDSIDPLTHQHRSLLNRQRFLRIAHDVAEPRQHPQTLRVLRVHRSVHVGQQIERLTDQVVPVLEVALLDLRLAGGVKVVR